MILAVLQARMSSSRLPGKVLKPILGVPMLQLQVERLQRAERIDQLIVATSVDSSDDAIEALCRVIGISCVRGSLDDVLDRFYVSALKHIPSHVVRLTGDCPLTDPWLIDDLIKYHLEGGFDYSSNCLEPTYPDGLDAEIMKFHILEEAWRCAEDRAEREHVTLYIHSRPQLYNLGSYRHDQDLSNLRWTVDEEEDLDVVRGIYEGLYSKSKCFSTRDILDFLSQNPEFLRLNNHIARNEGLAKSLAKSSSFQKASSENISFVPAKMDDADILFQWRNDPLTRQYSINQLLVRPAEHRNWLAKSLKNPKRLLFIAKCKGQSVGTVRFDQSDTGEWELSWTISPDFRGKGIGKAMVKAATTILGSAPLKAQIFMDHSASKKIAQDAGFEVSERDMGARIEIWRLGTR